MGEIKFKSLNDLYTRLYPAFNTKKNELIEKKIIIREIDLWNYLKENIWSNGNKLSLYDMINDIFNLDEKELIQYLDQTR